MAALRVFLVDEHEVVRRGVAAIIGEADDMEVVGQASTVRSTLLQVATFKLDAKPDVVVLGALFHIGSGIELCRDLVDRFPTVRVLILTAERTDEATVAAFLAGAAGYADKAIASEDLVQTIRIIGSGASLLDPRAAAVIIERLRNPREEEVDPFAELTESELIVLGCLAQGLTNNQIATKTCSAEKTVKNRVSHILAKLGLTSRTQAALAYATERVEHS